MFKSILQHPQFKKLPPNLRFTITLLVVVIFLLLLPYIPFRLGSPPSLMPATAPQSGKALNKPFQKLRQEPEESSRPSEGTALDDQAGEPGSQSVAPDPQPNKDPVYSNKVENHQNSALDDLQHELGN